LGASPYICGDPVRPDQDDVFFGREDLITDIRRHVIRNGNVILLEGNRRAGKSSILRHLEGLRPVPGWLGVYCSLQGTEGSNADVGVPTVEVFRGIARSIAGGLRALEAGCAAAGRHYAPRGAKGRDHQSLPGRNWRRGTLRRLLRIC
jgi:type I restriction enzyme M protein